MNFMKPKRTILDEAEARMNAEFLREYGELCKKYGRALIPSLQFQIAKINDTKTDDNRDSAGAVPGK